MRIKTFLPRFGSRRGSLGTCGAGRLAHRVYSPRKMTTGRSSIATGGPVFHDVPAQILARMHELEHRDAVDRSDGTPLLERLRQVPAGTGRFLALLAAGAPDGPWIEIGTSAGYSALWLSLACRATGRRLTTFEVLAPKAALARETFAVAGVGDVVDLVEGDFLDRAGTLRDIAFCFLDAEKNLYRACYEVVVPLLCPGGSSSPTMPSTTAIPSSQ